MSRVTLIVPVYNAQQWLKPCVESIVCQTFEDWDLILVDDGSSDYSLKICEEYAAKDSRISVIHRLNGGPSAARNTGLDAAKGDFVAFIDADDAIHHEMLDLLLKMHETTDAEICMAAAVNCVSYQFKPIIDENYKVYSPDEAIEKTLYQSSGLWCSMCNTLYKRELFDDLRPREGTRYEDLDFFYKIFGIANRIAYSEQVTYHYRANPTSYINTWSAQRLDVLDVVDKLVEYMAKKGSAELQKAASDRRFSAYYNMFVLSTINNEKEVATKCWQVIRENRFSEITNPKVRAKNKIGAALALMGRKFTECIVRLQK